MIKLNNKNITYVALADSNNSLKALKEIWYADSSNSVKLVYRRKDALIEGEDYEKYHWLVSDGDCYIDTLQKYRPYSDSIDLITKDNLYPNRETNLNKYNLEEFMFGYVSIEIVRVGAYIPTALRVGVNVVKFNSYNRPDWITYCASTNVNSNSIHNIHLNKVTDNKYSFEYNGTTFNDRTTVLEFPSNYEIQGFLYLFNINDPTNAKQYFNGAFNTYIHYRDDIAIQNLVPCKLLKPVPKWLDANGIRRQVGECGMIDLVSGKFYGNVNSVGTFTVENYYERKEWLVGDGSAYIDTLHLANEGLLWETHVSNLSFKKYFVWNRIVNIESPAIALYHSATFNGIVRVQNNYTNSIELQNQTDYDYIVATNSNGTVINGVQYIEQSASENISNKSIKLFYCDLSASTTQYVINNGGNSQDVRCAYFRFINNGSIVQNLIPCTLTMDLPASMDANNIARTKGTSGMWDLVSDRFYGNVANSGTFKAVNLAEGVDYEVHQWLRIDVNTMQYTRMMSLPVNSYQFSFRRKWLRQGTYYIHSSYFNVADYPYFTNQNIKLLIWDVANATCTYDSGTRFNLGDTITINCNAENYNFDEVSMPIYGVCNFIPFDCGVDDPSVGADIAFLTSSITVDGIERYIPVKLLKSIPSKYDANGIARQAGECGMYDTVNDKFYGNVASSGTFTVSD